MTRIPRIAFLLAAIAAVWMLFTQVLPWMAREGYAGQVVQRNYEERVDATPLFYTNSEATMAILRERATREPK
ncbi:MAG: hypothetical protein IT368_03250 [Candidatus Hydrogenedentes bacterium]|nr:hypothetical protein [Candidatus Hydrogenedentota bacterium]